MCEAAGQVPRSCWLERNVFIRCNVFLEISECLC